MTDSSKKNGKKISKSNNSRPLVFDLHHELKVLEEGAKHFGRTRESAYEFLVKGGFLTKSGKLSKRYKS